MVKTYIQYRDAKKVLLPVNPSEVKVQTPGKNTVESVIGIGEVVLLRPPGLEKISFDSFIPVSNLNAGYVVEGATSLNPQFYIDWFSALTGNIFPPRDPEPVTLIITGLSARFVFWVTIENFDYSWEAPDVDMHYSLEFKRYRKHGVIVIQPHADTPATPAPETEAPPRENTAKEVAIGSVVMVNGVLHRDSYGAAPGQTESDAMRRISHINMDGSHPYHVTTLEGGWRGWVLATAVEVVE